MKRTVCFLVFWALAGSACFAQTTLMGPSRPAPPPGHEQVLPIEAPAAHRSIRRTRQRGEALTVHRNPRHRFRNFDRWSFAHLRRYNGTGNRPRRTGC